MARILRAGCLGRADVRERGAEQPDSASRKRGAPMAPPVSRKARGPGARMETEDESEGEMGCGVGEEVPHGHDRDNGNQKNAEIHLDETAANGPHGHDRIGGSQKNTEIHLEPLGGLADDLDVHLGAGEDEQEEHDVMNEPMGGGVPQEHDRDSGNQKNTVIHLGEEAIEEGGQLSNPSNPGVGGREQVEGEDDAQGGREEETAPTVVWSPPPGRELGAWGLQQQRRVLSEDEGQSSSSAEHHRRRLTSGRFSVRGRGSGSGCHDF